MTRSERSERDRYWCVSIYEAGVYIDNYTVNSRQLGPSRETEKSSSYRELEENSRE